MESLPAGVMPSAAVHDRVARKLIGTVQPVQPITVVGTIGEALYSSSPVEKYREKSMWSSISTACSNSPEPRVSNPSKGRYGRIHNTSVRAISGPPPADYYQKGSRIFFWKVHATRLGNGPGGFLPTNERASGCCSGSVANCPMGECGVQIQSTSFRNHWLAEVRREGDIHPEIVIMKKRSSSPEIRGEIFAYCKF